MEWVARYPPSTRCFREQFREVGGAETAVSTAGSFLRGAAASLQTLGKDAPEGLLGQGLETAGDAVGALGAGALRRLAGPGWLCLATNVSKAIVICNDSPTISALRAFCIYRKIEPVEYEKG